MNERSTWRRSRRRFLWLATVLVFLAIAVPNFKAARANSRSTEVQKAMRTFAIAVEAYAEDTGSFPRAHNVEELARLLEPTYMIGTPRIDPWGQPYRYEVSACDAQKCQSYAVGSSGKNGVLDEPSLFSYARGPFPSTMSSDDVVYTDGVLLEGRGPYR